MDSAEWLAKERRARLAAERMLAQKQRELAAAHEKLALHARSLSEQIVEQRQVVRSALSEAEDMKGQTSRALSDLDRAQTAAVLAERRLWDSIDTLSDGFAIYDPDLRLVAANRAYLAVFAGHDVGPGTGFADLLRLVVDRDLFRTAGLGGEDWCAHMLARWQADPIPPEVVQLGNGGWLRLEDHRSRDGNIVTLAVDITEQMQIWAGIEALPNGFMLFDHQDRMVKCNQRLRSFYPVCAEVMEPGAHHRDILRHGAAHGQFAVTEKEMEAWLRRRGAAGRRGQDAFEHRLPDGRWLRVIEQRTPDGGWVSLQVDITGERAQQAALESARLAAEAANRAKSAFLANMSHEIRTPMNGVVGMADLLCDTPLTEDQRLFAETIKSSGEALLVIINDILDYSKIEAERLTLHPEPFDLERSIHEVAMLLQPQARAKHLDVMIDFDMFLPTRYIGDPGRLRQILTNLAGNAVKFTASGHVMIRVVGHEEGEGAQTLHVSVEDTGIGIAPDDLEHVFGEFNQVESESNRKFQGTGLGLAITRQLIDRMGGSLWVDSEPGRGSCFGFRVTLPVAGDTPAPHQPIRLRRALVVDEVLINRTILERQLVPWGIGVTMCRSGAEALQVLAQDPGHDVVLADQQIPEIDGLALARRLSELRPDLPVILLSSNPAALREQDRPASLAAILQKPLLRSDLYRRLQALSGGPPPPPPAPDPAPPVLRRMRVLAAEDNRTNQLVLGKMVRDLDIELIFAGDGREAVELYRSLSPDLIFMDISMPRMDGREAARAIRALEEGSPRRVPIIAVTAHAMQGDAADILAAGIDRYLTKPLRKSAIIEALTAHRPEDAAAIVPGAGAGE